MKKLISFLFCLLCCQIIAAQRVCYSDGSITIEGDPMTWTLATDGTQYPWVTSQYQWGKAYYEADGEIALSTERRQDGNDLVETYTFQTRLSAR